MDFFDFVKANKLFILIVSLILNVLLVGFSIYYMFRSINNKEENITAHIEYESLNNEEVLDDFYVEVKGAVKKPGVYKLNKENIINDLIIASGGFTKNAYTKNINLSRNVSKELVVYVYTANEYKKAKEDKIVYITKEIEVPCECSTYDISNCVENGISQIESGEKDTVFESSNIGSEDTNTSKSSLININTATKEELQTLSGIGESKAKDIIEYRTTNGNFKDISEIKNVSGIGNALFEKIKDYITV